MSLLIKWLNNFVLLLLHIFINTNILTMKNLSLIFVLFFIFSHNLKTFSQCTPVPSNDSPCMGDPNSFYDLGYGGDAFGTTCCAIGYNDDPNADKANVSCGTATDDDAVWYRMNINPNYDGIMLSVYDESGVSIGYEHSVEVYAGSENAICDGTAELIKAYCIGEYVSESYIGCLQGEEFLFIKVSSTESDCGTFHIDARQDNAYGGANTCEVISDEETLYPVSSISPNLQFECVTGYLNNDFCAAPEVSDACDVFETNPTMWYKVVVDEDANQLYTNVTTQNGWTPVWSVFKGDCSNLINAAAPGEYKCSTESSPLLTTVSEGVYYIAVSSEEGDIYSPYFELCVSTTKIPVICLGEEDYCDNDESTSFQIINRENIENESNGPPYNGPFCPGEKLTMQVKFTYHTEQTNDERLLAMIPDFGNGWDIDYYDLYANPPVTALNVEAEWYEEDNSCYPYVTEPFEDLCIYFDDNSKMHLCNILCEDCPCNTGMEVGDQIPSGYFWVQDSDENTCDSEDCSPSTKRGVPGINGETTVIWTIELKVKELSDSLCEYNDDLSVSFMTFSDGVAGCHSDKKAECLLDKPQHSPRWKVNCQMTNRIVATPDNKNICTGDTVGIKIKSVGDTTKMIVVSYDDNPYVQGEKRDTFSNGFGVIDDTLTLLNGAICDSQVVYYYAELLDNVSFCTIKTDTIKVYVHPKPLYSIDKTDETAFEAKDGTANIISGCNDKNYSFEWSTGDTTAFIQNLAPGKYFFTISSEVGCSILDSIVIEPYICADLSLDYQKNDVNCYGECTGSISINNLVNGKTPFNYQWNTGDFTSDINNLCAGMYFVKVTDSVNCSIIDSIIIDSPEKLLSNISSTNEMSLGANDGTAGINPSGGTGPYTIIWSTGDTSLSIANLSPGTYYVTITDAKDCILEDSATIQSFECSTLNIVSQQQNVSCFGECDASIIISNVENSTGALNYQWNTSDNSASLDNLCLGTYTVTITDSLGCSVSKSFSITQPEDIIITIDSVKNIDSNGYGAIFITTNGQYEYSWTGPKGDEGNTKNLTGIDSAGCYTFVAIDTTTDCSKDTTICIEKILGLNKLTKIGSINLYPNPASTSFYLSLQGFNDNNAEITIYDVSGKKVLSKSLNINKKLNSIGIQKMKKGLYFVKISLRDIILFKKLVVGI